MAISKTRVITKWKKQYNSLINRRKIISGTGVIHKRLDQRIKELSFKIEEFENKASN